MKKDVLIGCIRPRNLDEVLVKLSVVGAVDCGERFTCDANWLRYHIVARRRPKVELNRRGACMLSKDVLCRGQANEVREGLVDLLDQVEAAIIDGWKPSSWNFMCARRDIEGS